VVIYISFLFWRPFSGLGRHFFGGPVLFLRKWAHVLRKEPTENDSCPPEHTGVSGSTIFLNEWLLHLKEKPNLVVPAKKSIIGQETPKPRDLN